MRDTRSIMPEALPKPLGRPSAALRCVFVYGTLRAGGRNDIRRFQPPAQWVGRAQLAGTLYHLGGYPGLVLGGAGRVLGEVWRIAPALEAQLDRLEDVRADDEGEYRRREVRLLVDGEALDCLVYEIHPDRIRGRAVIAAGDWMACGPRAD